MREDRVGVGDIGAVHGGARGSGDTTGCDDGRGAGREHDKGLLSGLWLCESYVSGEPSGYWVGIDDGTRVELWAC